MILHLGLSPMNTLRRLLPMVMAIPLSLTLLTSLPSGASTAVKPAPSNVAVAQAVALALTQKSLAPTLNPSLVDISKNPYGLQGRALLKPSCDPYNDRSQVAHPVPCILGTAAAKKTIVIFGDSYVGNWLPALDQVGKNLGYRIAAFEFAGCLTAFTAPTTGPKATAFSRACDEYHAKLPASVKALKPAAILAANGTQSFGALGDGTWIAGMQKAFDEMAAPSAKRIIISISPSLPSPAPSCLAAYATNIQKCDLHYVKGALGSGLFSGSLVRDQKAAAAAGAIFLPTVQWFCVAGKCPAVVNNLLVYADGDHTTTAYSQYLATVLQNSLIPKLR